MERFDAARAADLLERFRVNCEVEAGSRQVAGAQIGLVHGIGGLFSTSATVVLAND